VKVPEGYVCYSRDGDPQHGLFVCPGVNSRSLFLFVALEILEICRLNSVKLSTHHDLYQ
jgi:hypothetical protein